MKLSLALPALYVTSHLCGRVYSIAAPLVASEIEEGDDNKDVLEPASHSHEFLLGPPVTSMNMELNVSADAKENLDRSLQKWKQRFYMWNQLGKRLPNHFTDNLINLEAPNVPSVAMNSDGSRLVVGIAVYDFSQPSEVAEAIVYDLLNNQWELKQTISMTSYTAVKVAISGNGNHIALQRYDLNYSALPVMVYLMGENGTFQALVTSTLSGETGLGISKDGNRIIQGSPNNNGGLVTLYEYALSTSTYEVIFSNSSQGGFPSSLGASVAISGNGNRIAYVTLYSPGDIYGSTVTVFENDKDATIFQWTRIGEIRHPDGDIFFSFEGEEMAMSAAGTRLVVGDLSMSTGYGVTYVFDQVSGTSEWILEATIEVPNQDEFYSISDSCGKHISISEDGKKVAMKCTDSINMEEYVAVYAEDSLGAWSPLANNIKDPLRSTFTIESVAMTSDGGRVAMGMYYFMPSPTIVDITVYTLGSTVCFDSPLQISVQEMTGDVVPFFCKWAEKGLGSICDPSQTMGQLGSHCPRVCSTCEDYACVDSDTSFFWKGVERDCSSWLSTMSSSEVADLCAQNAKIRKTCRGSCGRCLPSN